MLSAKKHIRLIVDTYTKLYPEEWEDFKQGMKAVRAMPRDDFATLDGTKYTRALYEMPETLQMLFVKNLTDEEMLWLKTGVPTKRNQGGHWFAKTFKEFAIPNKI